MGIFDRLRELFTGSDREPSDEGIYTYIKLDGSGEVVRVRLSPGQELNPDYEAGGYITRKTIIGPRSFRRAEALFRFDESRRLIATEVEGGSVGTQQEWEAQAAASK